MDERLAGLLEQYHTRLQAGMETPAAPDDTLESPELLQQLEDASATLRLIERVCRSHESLPNQVEGQTASKARSADDWTIGRFRIVRELGRGGHGIVFQAWDPAAMRHVALKTPHPDVLFTTEMRERFLREGVVAARLAHPNILSVLEVGYSGALYFIVSPYCQGTSLAAYLAEHGPVAPCLAASWVADLADGVEHAHCHGVLHRDIKPGNVLLDDAANSEAADESASRLIPRLTDFGLAKLSAPDSAETRAGTLLGTPAYMAPEQVDSSIGDQGAATDVYSLGVLLYELLVGRPPYGGETHAEVICQVQQAEPPAPKKLGTSVPRDLEAICMKCLDRNPTSRYHAAGDLAADLRRYLAGEVTHARPLGWLRTAWKWARRRPATAVAIGMSGVAILGSGLGGVWHIYRVNAALASAQAARAVAERHEAELQQLVFYRDLQDAHRALDDLDASKASRLLRRHVDSDPDGFLWRHLTTRCFGRPLRTAAHRGHVHSVQFSPNGQSLLTAGADGHVILWNSTGQKRKDFRTIAREASCASFAPDGETFAAAEGNRVRWWQVSTGHQISTREYDRLTEINWLAWSPDGKLLAAAGTPGNVVIIWNLEAGSMRSFPAAHHDEINELNFSPDGSLLATASSDKTVGVWDVTSGTERIRFSPLQTHVTSVRFSPDGRCLATCGACGSVKIWRLNDGFCEATFETNTSRIDALAFSPREPVVAFGDGAGIIRQWNWQDDTLPQVIDGARGRIMAINFAPRASALAVGATDGSVSVWNYRTQFRRAVTRLQGFGAAAAFSADSQHLFVGAARKRGIFCRRGARWVLEDVTTARCALGWIGAAEGNCVLAYDRFRPRQIRSWSLAKPDSLRAELKLNDELTAMAVTPDQRFAFTAERSPQGTIRGWSLAENRHRFQLSGGQVEITCMAASADGTLLASGGGYEAIQLWKLPESKPRQKHLLDGGVYALAFSPNSNTLAAGGQSGLVRIWDNETGQPGPYTFSHGEAVTALAFCPDEPLLVTGDSEGTVRMWSLANGEEMLTLGRLPGKTAFLTFSPDAQWLAAGSEGSDGAEGETRLWHAPKDIRDIW